MTRSVRTSFLILCILSPALLQAGPWLDTLEGALLSSGKAERPILVEVYADWCGYCRIMRREIFDTPKFLHQRADYTLLSVNGEKDTNFADRFHIDGFPTILFLDHNGVEIRRIEGYANPERFYSTMQSAYQEKDQYRRYQKAVVETPKGFKSNYDLGNYYAEAHQHENARSHFWKAYQSHDTVMREKRERVLYNIAILSMRLEQFGIAASIFDAFVRNSKTATTDVVYARYWRAVSRMKVDPDRTERREQIREDLAFSEKSLPFPADRKEARRLLEQMQ